MEGSIGRKTVGVFLDDFNRVVSGGGITDDEFYLVGHVLGDDRLDRLLEETTVVVVRNDDGKEGGHKKVGELVSGGVEEWRGCEWVSGGVEGWWGC